MLGRGYAEDHASVTAFRWNGGPLGEAVESSYRGRILTFIPDADAEALALFRPECREHSDAGDWYGEHVGKWLVAAAHALRRTGDPSLRERIQTVVEALRENQGSDGYLGTYGADAPCRFTNPSARESRTWDLWVHAWTMRGLLAVAETDLPERIARLIMATFPRVHPSVLDLGNHQGLSSAVLVHPFAELAHATDNVEYADFARSILDQAEERRLAILTGDDVAGIGTGKIYQLLWTLWGVVELYRFTGERALLEAVQRHWEDVATHHLTPLGGPWGGIAGHKEVFNARGFFSPYGMVETCSAQSWMGLSHALLRTTGEARYAAAIERTLLNTILGAIDANGRDWSYFTFPNGRRNSTYHWACCKSSGAMALEEASAMVVTESDTEVRLNMLLDGRAELLDGYLEVGDGAFRFATDKRVLVRRGEEWIEAKDGMAVAQDETLVVHPFTHTVDHHGQEIVRMDYAYLQKGPYVYATGLIDGFRREETLRLPRLNPVSPFRDCGDHIELRQPGRAPIVFEPYYRAGGRHDAAWRSTWMQVAWQ